MTGSPVTQTTYTARQLDDLINERLRERDAEWTAFQNNQLQAKTNELMDLRTENEALKQQMDEVLTRMEGPTTEEDHSNRNHSFTTEDDEELALSRRQVSPVESETCEVEEEDEEDDERQGCGCVNLHVVQPGKRTVLRTCAANLHTSGPSMDHHGSSLDGRRTGNGGAS